MGVGGSAFPNRELAPVRSQEVGRPGLARRRLRAPAPGGSPEGTCPQGEGAGAVRHWMEEVLHPHGLADAVGSDEDDVGGVASLRPVITLTGMGDRLHRNAHLGGEGSLFQYEDELEGGGGMEPQAESLDALLAHVAHAAVEDGELCRDRGLRSGIPAASATSTRAGSSGGGAIARRREGGACLPVAPSPTTVGPVPLTERQVALAGIPAQAHVSWDKTGPGRA